jgi:hypothetical protein
MLIRREEFAPHRLARLGALLAIAGILLSGPLAAAVIHAVRPQPQWQGARAFVEAWHPVQLLPYFCGFFFVGGCVVLVVGMQGHAFLGLGPWIAAPVFDRGRHERAVRGLLVINGLVGLVGAGLTVGRLDWVLGTAGLVSYAGWNMLFLVTLVLAAAALHRRVRAGVP